MAAVRVGSTGKLYVNNGNDSVYEITFNISSQNSGANLNLKYTSVSNTGCKAITATTNSGTYSWNSSLASSVTNHLCGCLIDSSGNVIFGSGEPLGSIKIVRDF